MKNLGQISMGEGNTPIFRLFNLEKFLDWRGEIWVKAEYQNPTGSFKDRGSITEVSEALKRSKKGVVCASTGNMAASLSAYAARAKLKCLVVVPSGTPLGKLLQTIACGAKIIEINGNYDLCVKKAKEIAEKNNYLLCGDYELRRLGQRSLGRELAVSGIDFDAFVVPVGNGTLGCAIIEGFIEKDKWPKFIGVQGKGSDPLTQTWEENSPTLRLIEVPQTVASAMKVGAPLDGRLTLNWVKETNGMILSVNDGEILKAKNLLAKTEGIYVETSAAATLAALIKSKIYSLKVVLILTGNGLKEK
ncbi:MAG: Threonine synthase [Candidatus Roizmanbacteria bacterium GW2011_GWA2_35_19]|uniref:Threonine synthase n=2 Tax=Candidatus Roizmaniibacteriota TaxID=1752723 RepID=A0A0G0BYS4_9BACT|nr:MAG: Threonine synthase [Candidatus Roizmanbacteria bacterium GW2011_GWC2_35_12]KKP74474.1 MAG: Threonine synthase [Candidatus Roizmanbacteria bacterium GW2011_GWA2_35_19]